MKVKNSDTWDTSFYPCYTPEEMLDLGVFMDCHYNVAIKGLPASWYKHPNVFPRSKEPDVDKIILESNQDNPLKNGKRMAGLRKILH